MKLVDSKSDYRKLAILSLIISVLMIIRKLIVLPDSLLGYILGFFWPIIGIIIFIKFFEKDGHSFTVWEAFYLFLVLYCIIYFPVHTFILFFFILEPLQIYVILFNSLIFAFGLLGAFVYIN